MIEPSCARCNRELPGEDPLRKRLTPEEARAFAGDHQPRRPVRVVRPGPAGERVTYWCSSRCFYRAFKKPEKKKRAGKPSADSYFHINRAA